MSEALNSFIKFDLHIHSKASDYKESDGIVTHSTKENIEVLLSGLNEHKVALFSITDHNRFDPELYFEIDRILSQDEHPYPNVKGVLAGIEFDVVLDEEMEKCHIIAVFDTKNDPDKLQQIKEGLNTNFLKDASKKYSKEEFEEILRKINLDTILIAAQRKSIENRSGNNKSLSDSTADVQGIIRVGYIDALEFQKPKVEGILLNNLTDLSLPVALFSGSDCHDWKCYPYHSRDNQNTGFCHSQAKMLPTFKGLLMAVTSRETRFIYGENSNTSFVTRLKIGEKSIPLVNGINAIIGENGSGKSTLLKLIRGEVSESHVKILIKDNRLGTDSSVDPPTVKYIGQGHIISKFIVGELFSADDGSHFKELDTSPFKSAYAKYSKALKKCIEASIGKEKKRQSLSERLIIFRSEMNTPYYYIDVSWSEEFESVDNPHEQPHKNISELLTQIDSLISVDYFEPYREQLEQASKQLAVIKEDVEHAWHVVSYEATVKNIMCSCIKDYERKTEALTSARDREVKEYKAQKRRLVDAVVAAIASSLKDIAWPDEPPILEGATKNPMRGFYFNREATYNGVSMLDNFFKKMFVKSYDSVEKLQEICSFERFSDALRNCTSNADINSKWNENFEKFIGEAVKRNEYIMDGVDQQIGNTLGEMSLSYYKFYTQDNQDWNVLIVDQPEDNISNKNISQELISYLNSIREKKQIIFVTHNPLLVVNLDVDNVVFVENNNGNLSASNGCLEFEDMQTNILKLVAQNMDGGKETIEKRLKVYGKNY